MAPVHARRFVDAVLAMFAGFLFACGGGATGGKAVPDVPDLDAGRSDLAFLVPDPGVSDTRDGGAADLDAFADAGLDELPDLAVPTDVPVASDASAPDLAPDPDLPHDVAVPPDLPPDAVDPGDLPADASACAPDVACPDDDDPCTAAGCDPSEGCVLVPITGAPCDDADPCTTDDQCVLGECRGQPKICADDDPCLADECHPLVGCSHYPVSGPACDDGDACTAGDRCVEGLCRGVALSCDDGNACTTDACDLAEGCAHVSLHGAPCDDGNACTTTDHCDHGVCTGKARACVDGNPCTTDACDPAQGCTFLAGDGLPCDDGNACTDIDRCAAGTCLGQATSCDDGNPCTIDSCGAGSGCIHTQPAGLPCEDGDACTTGDTCWKGACASGAAVDCDDGNACTSDACDPSIGCVRTPLDSGPCTDGNACTTGDACVSGTCVGSPVACDDGSPCTADSCDAVTGCVHAPLDLACDDGDPCTDGDRCEAGVCRPGGNPQCLAVDRVVLGGDSWSAGMVFPLRDALDARGYEEVTLTWELTAKPGSTVAGWLSNPDLMNGLYLSLDVEPRADILFFTLGGNDYLAACKSGLGLAGVIEWVLVMARIQADLQTFVALVKAGRPDLKVVLIGYDYLNLPLMNLLGIDMPGMDWIRFNLGMVELASRGRAVAAATPGMVYTHNMGLLQHTFGCPPYGPGVAPKPGPAPVYDPFPGGWYTYPSPAERIPDGIHPDYAGFRAIVENSLDQGPAAWIEGKAWP